MRDPIPTQESYVKEEEEERKRTSASCLVCLLLNFPGLKLPRRYTPALLRTIQLLPNPSTFTCNLSARNTHVKWVGWVLVAVTYQEGVGTSGRWKEEIGIRHFREPDSLKKMAAIKGLNSECRT